MSRYVMEMMVRDVNFSSELAKAQAMLQQTTVVTMGLQTAMNALRIGTMAGALSMAALVAPTVLLTTALADFDSSLRRAGAIGGKEFRDNLDSMGTQINSLAIEFGISADDIAAGVVELAKAGFDYQTITTELIRGTAQLAMVNQETFESTAHVITYAQALWGDSVENTYQLMEKMHVAANLSIMNISDLGSAFEQAGSSMVIAGASFDEFLAVIASLSNIAISSSENLGTLINRILVNGGELESILGLAPGSVISDGVINIKGLMEVLEGLGSRWEITSEVAQLWGVRSVKAFNAVMQTSGNTLKILEELKNSGGQLTDASNYMVTSFDNLIERLKQTFFVAFRNTDTMNALRDALISVSSAFESPEFATAIREFVEFSASFVKDEGPGLIMTIVEILKTFVSLAPEIREMALMFKNLITFVSKLDSTVLMLVASFVMMRKVFPVETMLAYSMATRNLNTRITAATLAGNFGSAGSSSRNINYNTLSEQQYISAATDYKKGYASLQTAKNNYIQSSALYARTNASTTQSTLNLNTESPLYYIRTNPYTGKAETYMQNSSGAYSIPYSDRYKTPNIQTQLSSFGSGFSTQGTILPSALESQMNAYYSRSGLTGSSPTLYNKGTQTMLGEYGATANIYPASRPSYMNQSKIESATYTRPISNMFRLTEATTTLDMSQTKLNQALTNSKLIWSGVDKDMNNVYMRSVQTSEGMSYLRTTIDSTGQSTQVFNANMSKGATATQMLGVRLNALKTSFFAVQMASMLASQFGMMAFMTGIMTIITSEHSLTKALGAITVAVGLLAIAFGMLYATSHPWMTLTVGVAAVTAMALTMRQQMKDASKDAKSMLGTDVSTGIMPTSTSVPTYAYDENSEGNAIGGKVLKTGWRYIHKGESVIPAGTIGEVDNKNNSFRNFMDFLGSVSTYGTKTNTTTVGPAQTVEKNSHYYDYKTINVYDTKKDDLYRVLRSEGLA